MKKAQKISSKHRREIIIPCLFVMVNLAIVFIAYRFEFCDRVSFRENVEKNLYTVDCDTARISLTYVWRVVLLVYKALSSETSDVGNILMTFAAITSAVVIMFYSLIDAKSFGIPHRTIMYYFIGSYTIPVVFFLLMGNIVAVYITAGVGMNAFAAVMTAYGILQQFVIIVMVMLSTSCGFNIWMITCEERWQYRHKKKLQDEKAKSYSVYETTHAKHAMECADLFSDRMSLINCLLDVPLWYIKKYYRWEFKKDRWEWQCQYIYEYYYQQIISIFSTMTDTFEREKIYNTLHEFISDLGKDKKLSYVLKEHDYAPQYEDLICVICGAFIHSIFVSNTKEKAGFLSFILNDIFKDDVEGRNQLLIFYFLMIVFLGATDPSRLTFEDIDRIHEWGDLQISAQYADFCQRSWKLLEKTTSISEKRSAELYNEAINVYNGLDGNSLVADLALRFRLSYRGGNCSDGT